MTLERDVRPVRCPPHVSSPSSPPPYAFEEVDGPIVSGTVMRLLDIQALTRTATIEVSYDT